MSWPLSQDYNEAIQSPESSFADPELRGGQPVVNALGLPIPRCGNFADVYQFQGKSGNKWALKCFTRHVAGLQKRYSRISQHLRQAKLPFTVDFTYLQQGIRIRGQWYPILKMEWVEGFLLNEFVRNNLDKPAVLEGLFTIWVRMAKGLLGARMAHADLQHGNVILVQSDKAGSLAVKLIDYDGMWVPALAKRKSGEVGHASYQHPQRSQQGIYSVTLDRLPLLAIACALRSLVVGGKALWNKYDNGDNLLFREADLRNPAASPLCKDLGNLPDAFTHDLVRQLTLGLAGPLDQVPLLHDVIIDDGTRPSNPIQAPQNATILVPGAKPVRPVPLPKEPPPQAKVAVRLSPPRSRTPNAKSMLAAVAMASVLLLLIALIAGAGVLYLLTRTVDPSQAGPRVNIDVKGSTTQYAMAPKTKNGTESPKKTKALPQEVPQAKDETKANGEARAKDEAKVKVKGEANDDAKAKDKAKDEDQAKDEAKAKDEDQAKAKNEDQAKAKDEAKAKHEPVVDAKAAPNATDGLVAEMKFVHVPKGSFWMGWDNSNKESKQVTIAQDFDIAAYTVTQEQWQVVMGSNPSYFSREGKGTDEVKNISDADLKRFPVENVSWDDVQEFIKKLNGRERERGWIYRLPSKAEWEYACRGGATTKEECSFDFYLQKPTNDLSSLQANFDGNYPAGKAEKGPNLGRTTKVGSYAPNKLGLHDMQGNVLQWCSDLPGDNDPTRFPRGGCWIDNGYICKASRHSEAARTLRNYFVGFRAARTKLSSMPKESVVLFTGHEETVSCIAVAPDGKRAISGSLDGNVRIWDLEKGTEILSFDRDIKPALQVAFSKDGQRFTSSAQMIEDGKRKFGLWVSNTQTGAVSNTMIRPDGSPPAHARIAALSPHGDRLAMFTILHVPGDRQLCTLQVYNLPADVKKLTHLVEKHFSIQAIAISPDGRKAVTAGNEKTDTTLLLWDLDTGRVQPINAPAKGVRCLAFLDDGKHVLAGGDDNALALWDLETGKPVRQMIGHSGSVTALAVSSDGRWALSGSLDKTVRLWDLNSGKELRRFTEHSAAVMAVAFDPNNRFAISGGADKVVRLWQLSQ
jgi:formylglycine-generating enzyme required for sulfatase activity